MTLSLKHKFASLIPDAGDPTIVQPSNWNDEHALTQATATILGRVSALTGPTEELTPAQARTLLNVADGATANSSDAFLLARANHTGMQLAATISDFSTASNILIAAALVPYSTTAQIAAAYQPLDSDLTSWAGVTRAAGFDAFTATPSSANLLSLLTTKTGTGSAVFNTAPTFSGAVTLGQDPASALQAATKQYVDNLAAGLDVKPSARVATTANVTLSAPQTIDGVSAIAGDRVVVKNQTLPAENGVYVVAAGAWTRATDMDAWAEVPGANVWVEEGTANADTAWVCTANAGGTIGTTAITWSQFGGTGAFQAASANLTSWAAITRAAGYDTFAATPTSANLRALLSDEVGTGAAYFVGGALGTPASGTATNLTGLPLTTGITGTLGIGNGGTGQTTAAAAFDALAPTTTRGDIIYRGASGNLRLAAGTSGYALIAAGAGADPAWTGFLQSGTGAATRTWNSKAAETITPYDFGAVGDGVADDTTALNNWFTRVAVAGAGELGFGTFRVTANMTWSCPRNCPKIVGNGSSYSKIAFDNGFGLTIQGVSGANPVFYGRFADFSIVGNIAGVLVKVANGASDAFNGVPFDNIVVNNNSTNALNKGVQFNAIYSSKLFMTVNCSGSTNGTAMEITGGSMNTIKAICGNASVGLHLTSTGLAVTGNFFDAVDLEVCATCVLIDSANVQDNTFIGGVISFNAVGNVGIDATAGVANEFRNMNYGGSGTLFHATVATHRKGFNWVNRVQNLVSTPAVPASTTAITNTNGQAALVNISGGTVSAIIVNGVTIAITTPATVFVSNDETISITYTVAPTWRWMPANF